MKQIGKLIISKSKEKLAYYYFKKRRKKFNKKEDLKRIAVIYFIAKSNFNKYNNWEDGFTKAIDLLEEDYQVTWINLEDLRPTSKELNEFDFLIIKSCWNWIVDRYIRGLKGLNVKRGIAISCSIAPKREWAWFYDVLWYETEWYKPKIGFHPNSFLAFGINSDVFKSLKLKKKYDIIGIGAITSYKRFEKFNHFYGQKRIIIGSKQSQDFKEVETVLESDIEIKDYVNQELLAKYINESNLVYIPAELDGGGERAVLEAMACGVPVCVEKDNQKLLSIIKGNSLITKFDYLFGLKRGLESLIIEKTFMTNLLMPKGNFIVGYNSFSNNNFKIKGKQNVTIGSYCSIGDNVTLITENHDYNYPSTQGYVYRKFLDQNHPGEQNSNPSKERTKGPIVIGNDVWIGDDVTILSGVKIGDGACIGTKSLVINDVPSYGIVGGLPAKLLKYRFDQEIIDLLLKIKWWFWSENRIKNNKEFFNLNLNKSSLNVIKKTIN